MTTSMVRGEHQPFDADAKAKSLEGEQVGDRVIFLCPSAERFLIQLQREKKFVIDGQIVEQEQKLVQFTDHTYITEDQETIAAIRKHQAYKRGTIIELKKLADEAKKKRVDGVLAQLDDPNVREAVVAALGVGKASVPTVKDDRKK